MSFHRFHRSIPCPCPHCLPVHYSLLHIESHLLCDWLHDCASLLSESLSPPPALLSSCICYQTLFRTRSRTQRMTAGSGSRLITTLRQRVYILLSSALDKQKVISI